MKQRSRDHPMQYALPFGLDWQRVTAELGRDMDQGVDAGASLDRQLEVLSGRKESIDILSIWRVGGGWLRR